tara:strand:- start:8 stop:883 length:876 start_codon:yes stop_codon:yes gene_type:complete
MAFLNISSLLDQLNQNVDTNKYLELPEEIIRFLPTMTQEKLEEFEKINGKIFLPQTDVNRLTVEAEAEKMGQQALLNDPQGKGFHGGDPELSVTVTDDPMEVRGREFRGTYDKYGSKPDVFRTLDPDSILLERKYLDSKINDDQYAPSNTPYADGVYNRNLDSMILSGSGNENDAYYRNYVEPHEYMHRGISQKPFEGGIGQFAKILIDSIAGGLGIPEIFKTKYSGEAQHDYIDEAFEKHRKKSAPLQTPIEIEYNEKLNNLKMGFIQKYNSVEIGTQKFNEFLSQNNLQ